MFCCVQAAHEVLRGICYPIPEGTMRLGVDVWDLQPQGARGPLGSVGEEKKQDNKTLRHVPRESHLSPDAGVAAAETPLESG